MASYRMYNETSWTVRDPLLRFNGDRWEGTVTVLNKGDRPSALDVRVDAVAVLFDIAARSSAAR